MKIIGSAVLFILTITLANGQNNESTWYSETNNNGIIIQNSYPKGGPYTGATENHFNHSSLVFFTRVANTTNEAIEMTMNFSADSIAIPNSPGTYMKIFLPSDTMSFEKEKLYNYGVSHLNSFNTPTGFCKIIEAHEEYLFYVVTIFYQISKDLTDQYRGGNRAELVMENQVLYYNMLPQIQALPCGTIFK